MKDRSYLVPTTTLSPRQGRSGRMLPTPLTQLSLMGELTYSPLKWRGWQFTGALALDRSLLIGYNFGGMITIRKIGKIKD